MKLTTAVLTKALAAVKVVYLTAKYLTVGSTHKVTLVEPPIVENGKVHIHMVSTEGLHIEYVVNPDWNKANKPVLETLVPKTIKWISSAYRSAGLTTDVSIKDLVTTEFTVEVLSFESESGKDIVYLAPVAEEKVVSKKVTRKVIV